MYAPRHLLGQQNTQARELRESQPLGARLLARHHRVQLRRWRVGDEGDEIGGERITEGVGTRLNKSGEPIRVERRGHTLAMRRGSEMERGNALKVRARQEKLGV